MDYLIQNANVLGEGPIDLYLHDGKISDPVRAPRSVAKVDAAGLIALPALVDPHTHLRDPGAGDAETIVTGLAAAAAGGYGAVYAMPNTTPVADTAEIVEYELDAASEIGTCDLYPIGAVTVGQKGGQVAGLEAMHQSRARVRMFSDDGHCVARSDLMREALQRCVEIDSVIAQHAQDPLLTENAQMDAGKLAKKLGKPGWPGMAESVIIARDVIMAGELGARLHVCHVSTASGVEVVRWAKQQGIFVSAEVTPHHLLLTSELVATENPAYKVNPPLRSDTDVQAVREAFCDGTIDMVGTDHAPHPDASKSCSWDAAANGMLGLETALPVIADLFVRTGRMTWRDIAWRMSGAPAALMGIENEHGGWLTLGRSASLCLVDPDDLWRTDDVQLASIARNTPYKGRAFYSHVLATLLRGLPTYDAKNLFGME